MSVTFKKLGNYGRLGNQIWQSSVTIAHALRNNDQPRLPFGIIQNYFQLPNEWFYDCSKLHYKTYEEPHFHYSPIPYWENQDLSGYFQSYKYISGFEDEIKKWYKPKIFSNKKLDGVTAIHVRREDYLKLIDCFEILDMNYYNKAMNILNSDKYIIFSNDIDWCKKNFVGKQFIISEGKSEIEDFSLMMECDNFIIANSSYSYWASFLGSNKNSKIIAPQKWFGPKLSPTHNTKDLYRDEWVLL